MHPLYAINARVYRAAIGSKTAEKFLPCVSVFAQAMHTLDYHNGKHICHCYAMSVYS